MRANLLQLYASDPINDTAFYEGCKKQEEFECLLLATCFFHAVIQERRQFGPIGWNIPYEFTDSDLRISIHQLKTFISASELTTPYEALKYVIGECNYGGRVTDDKDRRALSNILEIFLNESVVNPKYNFSKIPDYEIPMNTDHKSVVEYIKKFPIDSHPNIFSLHENADISKNQLETASFFDSVLLTQSRSDSASGKSNEQIIHEVASSFLEKIPSEFDSNAVLEKYPLSNLECMNTVLLQEVIRYNNLAGIIKESLKNVKKAVKGQIIMSSDLEDVSASILQGRIPKMWASKSYPSMKSLSGYVEDLIKRLNFFDDWIKNGIPTVYWLAGFYFTQSFLTGCLQNYSRKHGLSIDSLTFKYVVTKEFDIKRKPEEGQYISGLYLEGARWDGNSNTLVESSSRQLFDSLPIILVLPVEKKTLVEERMYECPIYKTSARRGTLSTTGHSTNFVITIKIPTNVDPSHWTRRGVAALLSLNN